MFDIDGTLTQTMALDTELYVQAVGEVLGLDAIDTDWSAYDNVTDAGVATQLIERHLDRAAEPRELDSVQHWRRQERGPACVP